MDNELLEKYVKYYQYNIEQDKDNAVDIQRDIDNFTYEGNTEYNGDYPELNDNNFIKLLSNKLEYRYNKSLLNINELSSKCEKNTELKDGTIVVQDFELTNNQQFLKNFINKNTPYKGLLIFHGVGVGKTCSAINISSSFRDSNMSDKDKIICLVSKNIRGSWKDTIYDKDKGNDQCSGDSFEDIINKEDNLNISNKKVDKLIKKYYDFYGYLKFANKVKRLINRNLGKLKLSEEERIKREKNIIRENFSNRILIIDEIHNLREDKNFGKDGSVSFKKGMDIYWEDENGIPREGQIQSTEGKGVNKMYLIKVNGDEKIYKVSSDVLEKSEEDDKKAKEIIEKVIDYSVGLRLIIMSATPMFNKSSEIVWLLNLLLRNDNRPIIKYDDIFKKHKNNDILTEKGINMIKDKSRGYISYLRGENPISFPIRLYPDNNLDKLCMGGKFGDVEYLDYPSMDLFTRGKRRISPTAYKFKFMKMYNNKMEGNQLKIYEKFIDYMIKNRKKNEIRLSDRNIGLQISNIVFSDNLDDGFKNSHGWKGFSRFMDEKIERKQKVCSYKDNNNPLFNFENLEVISCKFHNIIKSLLDSKAEGIIFIYSDFIYSGILPLALALEHIGIEKYGGRNILNYPEWKEGSDGISTKKERINNNWETKSKSTENVFNQAKYIILSGDQSLSPNNNQERKISLSKSNENGEQIKIILGNSVTSEGMDFKNIREIHVIDPWYHLYKIEQIIGRGIRLCSHNNLKTEKRNVTVYLHTSSISPEIESIDTNTYRMAEEKASQIGRIEKILKENAIDSILNKQINHIKNMKPQIVTTSRRYRKKDEISLDVNDQSYSKICSFLEDCNIDVPDNDSNPIIDKSTYTLENIKEQIKLISKILTELFIEKHVYLLNELIELVGDLIDTDEIIIYHSLDHMIDNKTIIVNNDVGGYIIKINNYYIFQPSYETDINIPLYYRKKDKNTQKQHILYDVKKIDINLDPSFDCSKNYNDIYEQIRVIKTHTIKQQSIELTPLFEKDSGDDSKTLGKIKKALLKHYLDKLTFSEKYILLKEILCEVINNNYEDPIDDIDKDIYQFFKDNIIRINEEEEFNIYDEKNGGNIIGFFIFNTNEYYKNKEKNILNDYTFYIYKGGDFTELDKIGKLSIQKKFTKDVEINKRIKRTTSTWGYSFKDENEKYIFKIVDKTSNKDIKTPGKEIGNKGVKPITIIKELKNYFTDIYNTHQELSIERITIAYKNLISHHEKTLEKGYKGPKYEGRIYTEPDIENFTSEVENKLNEDIKIKIIFQTYVELDQLLKKNQIKNKESIMTKEYLTLLFELSHRILNNRTYTSDTIMLKYGFR